MISMSMKSSKLDIRDPREKCDLGVSIIIPTYNREKTLKIALKSMIEIHYSPEKYEIIVVDNQSTDHTREVVLEFIQQNPKHNIKYIYEERQGVHYARNTGALESKFNLLYFTDDDVIPDPQLLKEIIKPFQLDQKVASATGRVLPIWEVTPPKWVVKHCSNSLLSILDSTDDIVISKHLNYIYSCHQAVRKSVLFEAGGFNPENTQGVWIGDGETGLVIKIESLGYKFGFNGRSITYHMIPPSRMTQSYLNKRIGNSGNCYAFTYYRKNRPSPFQLFLEVFILLFVKFLIRSIYYLIKAIIDRDIDYLRFVPAYAVYYFNRSRYNITLATNARLRKFVLKDNWFNDTDISIPF